HGVPCHRDSTSPSTAGGVVVNDTLPPQVTFLTSSSGCAEGPPNFLTCPVPNLAPGDTFTFTITGLVHSNALFASGRATTISNTATFTSGDTGDTDPSNNTATVTTTVVD